MSARPFALALLAAALAASPARAEYCSGGPDPNAQPNTLPIFTDAPALVKTVPNGKLFTAGAAGYNFSLIHVYGSAYEQGFAHGALLTDEVKFTADAVWQYMEEQIEGDISFLPAALQQLLADLGLELALDVLLDLTRPFTGAYFFDELRGLADGAGVDYQRLARIHLIGELTQGDCSMVGAWGPATAGGKTLALRALDWDTDGPFKQVPLVAVYHPVAAAGGVGHAFVNVGFIGWIGSLTGMSSKRLSIHEIGVSFPDATHFGTESFVGVPFVFLLRDILQFDNSVDDAVARITSANRTCDLLLGVGDGVKNTFRGFAYSGSQVLPGAPDAESSKAAAKLARPSRRPSPSRRGAARDTRGGALLTPPPPSSGSQVEVYNDKNLEPYNATGDTWHPRFPSVIYWGMDWLCPGYSRPLAREIQGLYGQITPENMISDMLGKVQTGDVHVAVYDLTDDALYVSFMAPLNTTVPQMAYDRQYTRLDAAALWAEPAPPA